MRTVNKFIFTGLFFVLAVCAFAQAQDSIVHADTTVITAQDVTVVPPDSLKAADSLQVMTDTVPPKKTKVYLIHSNTLSFDKAVKPDAQILNGDVCFRHDSSYMYCDSAYFFEQTNSLEAFSNVRMEQGDTLFVYGDYLFYDGNTQVAYLRENVRMENGQVTLFTDSLNYERIPNIGYYFEGGLIVDSLNQLSSFYGQYSPETKLAVFNDSVQVENPDFTLYSDTLHYDTESKVATILGPSVIVSDSGTIHTSRGWYDTVNNTSLLLDQSQVESGEKILIGDSIFYNRDTGMGEVYGNMSLIDTAQHVTLQGEYGYYNEQTGYAFATDSARFLEYSQGDTLFLHADTLQMVTVDSVYREIKAYYGVRFYRIDMQGVCDSMQFNTRDSVLYMYTEPVLWNEQYQLYGDTIAIYMNDSTIEYAHVIQFAFAALGGFLGWFFGGFDGFLYALIIFVVTDYFTGILAAGIRKELSSEVGFKGIAKKVCIFLLVGVANVIDTQVLQNGAAIRTAVIFFYLSNEGLSILENSAVIGIPIPEKLKDMLIQLTNEKHIPEKDDEKEG